MNYVSITNRQLDQFCSIDVQKQKFQKNSLFKFIIPFLIDSEIRNFSLIEKEIRRIIVSEYQELLSVIFRIIMEEMRKSSLPVFIFSEEKEKFDSCSKSTLAPSLSYFPFFAHLRIKMREIFKEMPVCESERLQFLLTGKGALGEDSLVSKFYKQYKKKSTLLDKIVSLAPAPPIPTNACDYEIKNADNYIHSLIFPSIHIGDFTKAFDLLDQMTFLGIYGKKNLIKSKAFADIISALEMHQKEEMMLEKWALRKEFMNNLCEETIYKRLIEMYKISLVKRLISLEHSNSSCLSCVKALIEINYLSDALHVGKMMTNDRRGEKEQAFNAIAAAYAKRGDLSCMMEIAQECNRNSLASILLKFEADGSLPTDGYFKSSYQFITAIAAYLVKKERTQEAAVFLTNYFPYNLLKSELARLFKDKISNSADIGDYLARINEIPECDKTIEEVHDQVFASLIEQGKEKEADAFTEKSYFYSCYNYEDKSKDRVYVKEALSLIAKGEITKADLLQQKCTRIASKIQITDRMAIEFVEKRKIAEARIYFDKRRDYNYSIISEYDDSDWFKTGCLKKFAAATEVAIDLMKEKDIEVKQVRQFIEQCSLYPEKDSKLYREYFSFILKKKDPRALEEEIDLYSHKQKQSAKRLSSRASLFLHRDNVVLNQIAALTIAKEKGGKAALEWLAPIPSRLKEIENAITGPINIYYDLTLFLAQQGKESIPDAIEAFIQIQFTEYGAHNFPKSPKDKEKEKTAIENVLTLIAIAKAEECTENELLLFIRDMLTLKEMPNSENTVFSNLAIAFTFKQNNTFALFFANAIENEPTIKNNVLDCIRYLKENFNRKFHFLNDAL